MVMKLEELTCPSCMTKIEGALSKQAGVNNVKVLFNASKIKLEFDNSVVESTALQEIVEKLGYQVISTKITEEATA